VLKYTFLFGSFKISIVLIVLALLFSFFADRFDPFGGGKSVFSFVFFRVPFFCGLFSLPWFSPFCYSISFPFLLFVVGLFFLAG